jgi:hypothetical protein
MFTWIKDEFYFEMKVMQNGLNGTLQTQTHVSCLTVKFGNVIVPPPPPPTTKETNSGALVRQRTIPTERPPLVGEASASFS